MTIKRVRKITYDEWIEEFKPLTDENGTLIEIPFDNKPHLSEAINNATIWTEVDVDGELYIVSGWTFVNRMSYFMSEITHNDDFIEVKIND